MDSTGCVEDRVTKDKKMNKAKSKSSDSRKLQRSLSSSSGGNRQAASCVPDSKRRISSASDSRRDSKTRGSSECASNRVCQSGRQSPASKKSNRAERISPIEVAARCYDVERPRKGYTCRTIEWQSGKYVSDECGSGIMPQIFDKSLRKAQWCKTPLSMYQATIGDLGHKMLCGKEKIFRDIKPAPPCNVCEYVLPPCRGYYRKRDCLRSCEEEHAYIKGGVKVYRDAVKRHWEPCTLPEQKFTVDANEYAPINAALALRLTRQEMDVPCW